MHAARSIVGLVTVATLVAACGSTGPTPAPSAAATTASAAAPVVTASPAPTPSAPAATLSPSATPSPSPSAPADVAAAFSKAVTDPAWAPHFDISGEVSYNAVPATVTGTVDRRDGLTHTQMTIGTFAQESINSSAFIYVKQHGVWFKTAVQGAGGSALSGVLGSGVSFSDAGVEAHTGRQLHRLLLPSGYVVPPSSMGIPAGAADAKVTVEAWADDKGAPVELDYIATWTQTVGKTPVAVAMNVPMVVTGESLTITEPTSDEVWTTYSSAVHRSSVSYPSTWELTAGSAKKADLMVGYDGSWLSTDRYTAAKTSLNRVVNYARTHLANWSGLAGAKLQKVTALTIGGLPARQMIIHGTYKGTTKYHIDLLVVKSGYVYELLLSVPRLPTTDDAAMWGSMVDTYSIR